MANDHGNLSRMGLCIQERVEPVTFPGWLSKLNLSRLKRVDGWVSNSMRSAGTAPPNWVSNVRVSPNTQSREYVHIMGRYPKRHFAVYRYEMDHVVDGRVSTISWNVAAIALARQEYWTQSPGHGRYYIRLQYMDGTSWDSGNIYLYQNWVGHRADGRTEMQNWGRFAGGVVGGKPIRRATLGFIAELRKNAYHDVGDRSPGNKWNGYYIMAGGITNAGFNLFEHGYTASTMDVHIDRLRTYEGAYNTPTPAHPVSSVRPPVGIRIT